MKKHISIASLTVLAAAFTAGCVNPTIGVDNPDDSSGQYSMGALETRYLAKNQDYIENVFIATKKALDDLKYYRTGESPGKDRITVYARGHGDIKITVDIFKKVVKTKDGQNQEWIYVAVRYGTWGDCRESQQIVSSISANLR